MLAYLAGNVGPAWGYVGPAWGYKEQQKNTVKRRIFWWSAAYLGAMLAHLGAMLAYLEGNVGPSWGYVGPSWGYVGPSWGLRCPILRLCWPILKPMLAHVDPSRATRSEKLENANSKKHRKTHGFWRYPVSGGRGGGPSLLRRGENCRTARTRPAPDPAGPLAGLPGRRPLPTKVWTQKSIFGCAMGLFRSGREL